MELTGEARPALRPVSRPVLQGHVIERHSRARFAAARVASPLPPLTGRA